MGSLRENGRMAARGGATVPPGQQHGTHGRDGRGSDARGSGPGAHAHGGDARGSGSGAHAHGPDAGKPGTQAHTHQAAAPPARRGRPRSEAVERSIIDAVVRLLEEGVAISDLSIERIARTAGVGKATIYRRWEGKESLLVDVVRSMEPVDPPLPGTSVRDDLVALVEMLRRRGLAKRSSALLHNVFAQMQSYPRLWEMYHRIAVTPRRERMDAVLRRGAASRTGRYATTSTSTCSATCSWAPCSYALCCGPSRRPDRAAPSGSWTPCCAECGRPAERGV
ncbi:AcrR family transcriptional regulator [Streptomyces sp. V4I23]|nr:AcrR family transcriptional regulator [Streptomyces sp. V4I23]